MYFTSPNIFLPFLHFVTNKELEFSVQIPGSKNSKNIQLASTFEEMKIKKHLSFLRCSSTKQDLNRKSHRFWKNKRV
jgi:hypothetical protein